MVELASVEKYLGDFLDGDVWVLIAALRLKLCAADKQGSSLNHGAFVKIERIER